MAIPASITEQIAMIKDLDISYRALHTTALISNSDGEDKIEIPYISILSKYRHFLDNIRIKVAFDDVLARKYLYKPKSLSYDLYGTTELWFELLRLNNWSSISEFKPKSIYVYDKNKLKDMLNEILILEKIL